MTHSVRLQDEHARGQMHAPGHPNKLSVWWIYCKQSLQEDHPDGVLLGFASARVTSGFVVQQVHDGLLIWFDGSIWKRCEQKLDYKN